MMMCAGFNFVTLYLLGAGILDRTIGILIAVSCTAAVPIQQLAGRAVDTGRLGRKSSLICLAAAVIAAGLLVAFNHSAGVKTVFYGLLLCITLVILPILNSFPFFYEDQGIEVNYGIARGIGSLCFSICSILLGILAVRIGTQVVPIAYAILGALFMAVMFFMPALQAEDAFFFTEPKKSDQKFPFIPAFIWMLVGLSLVMLCHNMTMTYFIHVIERAGGNAGNMGIANGIAAVVEIPVLFLYTKIKKNRPSGVFIAISGVAFLVKAVLFVSARSILMIYGIQCLQFLAYGLMAASRVYYVDEVVGNEFESTGQARVSATETIGIVLGSTIGGFVMNGSGIDLLLKIGAVVCLAGVLCMFVSVKLSGTRLDKLV